MTGKQTGGVVCLVMTIPLAALAVFSIVAEAKENPHGELVSFAVGSFLWSFIALIAGVWLLQSKSPDQTRFRPRRAWDDDDDEWDRRRERRGARTQWDDEDDRDIRRERRPLRPREDDQDDDPRDRGDSSPRRRRPSKDGFDDRRDE